MIAALHAAVSLEGEQPMSDSAAQTGQACTRALRRALQAVQDRAATDDLMFLEAWEMSPTFGVGAVLRVGQIRRANPALAAEIRAEVTRGRPLTDVERATLGR